MAFYTKIPVLVRQNTTVIANVTYNYPGLVYNISGLYRPGHAKFPTAPHWNFSISVDQTFTLVPNTLYLWPTQRDFVSGFYGPGPWAAWTISIVTTWIALFRDDYSNNMHLMGWLLYTNWAAIDMARQLINCHGLNPVPVDPYFTVGASLSILYMAGFEKCRPWFFRYYPCGTQAIGEWDQAFSLFFALFFFVYEFAHEIPGFARNCAKFLRRLVFRRFLRGRLISGEVVRWMLKWYKIRNGACASPSETSADEVVQEVELYELEAPQPAHVARRALPEDDTSV
ncbi:hypothetical protein KJE20_13813 [Pyrenophora tritici-repentis]|uniref:Uncharacterized protein n=1 Tax=Pyrenophora tritici-repentis TaxID=45151 RepID=A0A922NIY8_9PLEO|nr:hypothetical protein Ptr86124_004469 [Pyrenophora tritici-repentis]KAI1676564.1 hypothetical protein KJE20_13813 [Pyrenophora tritici-repentis]